MITKIHTFKHETFFLVRAEGGWGELIRGTLRASHARYY